ncbi:coiled-coil domain-containing protein 50 isoform X2 [Betta splendens]|uniref:Coiled-coil domain-containing protein 50 isoform X2 n=1 Tax=Betta splendens TaxID=158456 RepID=A0A6P7MDM5_BETSP|nr:coiled-coil domain-containing protein 50 isoform X2 [Betta splendens]
MRGVLTVCRDFAVLEDHCLAYNLQEQEIESHLASNVHKSRLVQKDLQVAKKLQEEEDQRAKVHIRKQRDDIERQDTEIAQEIQDRLVRQAEQQRKQEEKDAAIARKIHEREMKDERRRQKQLEANFEEEYFEDHGAKRRPLDLDKDTRRTTPTSYHREYSPNYNSIEAKRSRHPKQDPASPRGRSKYADNCLGVEEVRSRHADPSPNNLHHSRSRHGDRYPEYEPTELGRARSPRGEDEDSVVKRRERPARPPPPAQFATERGRDTHRDRDRGRDRERESHTGEDQRREGEAGRGRYRERSQDKALSQDRLQERDRQRQKDRQRARTRSSERDLEENYLELGHRKNGKVAMTSWDGEEDDGEREKSARGRQRVHSGPDEVFEEHRSSKGRADTRDYLQPQQEEDQETGHIVHKASGALVAETESKLSEATKGMKKLDLREQELKDMEVARRLQEEELKASKLMEVRAAQVAQDEEIARLLMEKEKKEYRKNREREKEKERERMAMDRRWQDGDNRPNPEDVVRPRTREEAEYHRQKNQVKPARPPQPRAHDYENVSSVYSYPDQPAPARPPTRPEAAYKGAYYKR